MSDIEPSHDDLDVGVEDDSSCFGIIENVELRERPSVTPNTSSTTHEHNLFNAPNEVRIASDEERHVGHGTGDSKMDRRFAVVEALRQDGRERI